MPRRAPLPAGGPVRLEEVHAGSTASGSSTRNASSPPALDRDPAITPDAAWFQARLRSALDLRDRLGVARFAASCMPRPMACPA